MTKKMMSKAAWVVMDDIFWRLIDEYHVIINVRLKQRGWPRVSRPRLLGAILSYYFLAHSNHTEEELGREERTSSYNLLGLLEPEELEALGLERDRL